MNVREVAQKANDEALRICEVLLGGGKHVGQTWVVGDVAGNAGDSMTVILEGDKRGQWYDHAAGAGGDMLKLVQLNKNLRGTIESADWIREFLGMPKWQPDKNRKPEDAFDPMKKAWKLKSGQWIYPTAAWAYRDALGAIIAYACRFDFVEDGKQKKDVIPLRKGDDGQWHWKGWTKNEKRPLFGAEFLDKTDDGRPLVIVEGEKKVLAARKLLGNVTAVTWQGGASSVSKADWKRIREWKGPVVIWPDNDDAGQTAATYLLGILPKARKVMLPDGLPDGWDIADPAPEGVSIKGLFDAALLPPVKEKQNNGHLPKPYQALGMDERGYYFLNRAEGYILHYPPSQLKEMNIYRIAPDSYWESLGLFKPKSTGLDYVRIAKILVGECQEVGAFDIRRARGRGVHMDKGRVVVHLGDRLMVDGVMTNIADFKSEFIYPKRPAVTDIDFDHPLSSKETVGLLDMLKLCSWAHQRSAYLLAGWIWCALICGVLPWRPHVFMQGESSSGKTWILTHIVFPIIRELSRMFLACASSEAGVRQDMGIDSLATLLEEFDGDQAERNEGLYGMTILARQSSSEVGGHGVKGTQDGVARNYILRSCFMFIGTAAGAMMKSDRSRVAVLELQKAGESNFTAFPQIQAMARVTTGLASWVASFKAKVLTSIPETLQAIQVFNQVASAKLKDTRAGDQYGSMLAGSWMVEFGVVPTIEEAMAYYDKAMGTEDADVQTESDQSLCHKSLLAYRIDYEDHGIKKATIASLLHAIFQQDSHPDDVSVAKAALQQWGIRIAPDLSGYYVLRGHRQVTTIFRGTPFENKWHIHLSRLPGAYAVDDIKINFFRSSAVFIPVEQK